MRRILVLLLVVALSSSAPAEEQGAQDRSEGPVVVSFIAHSVDQRAGRVVIEEAYRRLGIDIQLRGLQADEALQASNRGEVDAELMRMDGIQLRFTNLTQVPIPINFIQGVAFSRDYKFPILGWHSLRPYTVGIVRGIRFAEDGTDGMDVRAASSYAQLAEWIHDGTVDVGVMPRITGRVTLHDTAYSDVEEMDGVLETMLAYHYLHETNADLKPRLSKVLKEMLLEGTTKRLRAEAYSNLFEDD